MLQDNSKQIQIKEYIKSANGTVRGKIEVKIDNDDPIYIFYTNANNKERLYVSGAFCNHYSYNHGWSRYLTKIGNTFVNYLILLGPSVIFRINGHSPIWNRDKDEVIRGVNYHSAYTDLGWTLKVWFYFKGDRLEGLKRPSRAYFSGYDEYSVWDRKGQYWFDFYTIARVDQNFDTIVTPKPGLVCDQYLSYPSAKARAPFPKLTQHTIHFIARTKSLNAGPTKKEEVYADEKYQILRIKSSTYGKDNKILTNDILYDYELGLEYGFTQEGNFSASPMSLSAPGIVEDTPFTYGNYKLNLNRLLNFDLNYRYLGPVFFEDRDEIGVHAWEILNKDMEVGGKVYPNVVTTQYFSGITDGRTGYTLVGTTKKAYDSNKKLLASLTTTYFDIGFKMSSSDSMGKFSVEDFYVETKAKKTIKFFFNCTDVPCNYLKQYSYQIQDAVKKALVNTGTISASRITNIETIIDSNEIIIYVTILDFPRLKNAFKMQNMKLSEKTFTTLTSIRVDDDEACLRTNSYKHEPFTAIAFCKAENGGFCYRIDGAKVKLVEKENNGISCSVYMTPLKNIYRYSRELPLENIHERLGHIKISLTSPNDNEMFTLTPYQVTDVTKVNDDAPLTNSLYEKIIENTKLIEDKLNTIQVVGTNDLGSCRRKCILSAENNCQSFSFCDFSGRVECFLSTVTKISSEKITHDRSCETYLIDNLTKYKKIAFKRFNNIEQSVASESSLEKCASLCSNSESCKSFQFCSGSCSLAGYYTDESSVLSDSCNIYIPKVLDRFELTGKWIVADLFHTELNLNADQCAALCFQWSDNGTMCKSFNFCPTHGKTSSLCHLSKYSIHDASVKLIHSDTCQNYEKTEYSVNEQLNNINKVTHSWTIFGILVLFITTGLISGVAVAVGYFKFASFNRDAFQIYNRNTFSWSKQLNDERQSVNGDGLLQMSSEYAIPVNE
ncbi:uncharacterized protein LOC112538521 [Tetranychus urticae]|uniref:uncharacterized protein LOC112538521 n=1 Tax=Tetranychus urticae TaxID=32264 RepID=UPI000D64B99E|nr:uncharacterized protein LOC112538521 [Tetranychus urticae]